LRPYGHRAFSPAGLFRLALATASTGAILLITPQHPRFFLILEIPVPDDLRFRHVHF
jgi:hypothetical protein